MRKDELADSTCSISQALAVVGDPWSLLVVRDVAGGVHRFDALQAELAVSRRTLAERLVRLVEGGVLERRAYQERPPRHEYHLTRAGEALLPALVALQDWGSRFVLGDGSVSATAPPTSVEARRVHGLVGTTIPALRLPDVAGTPRDPLDSGAWTVLACLPGAMASGGGAYPPGWGDIPGAPGCTLEASTWRDRAADLTRLGAQVRAVSTARPDQLAAFADELALPFPLLSDEGGRLVTALRLPTFRAGGAEHLKRLTLLVDPGRTVRAVQYPVVDPAGSVDEALGLLADLVGAETADGAGTGGAGAAASARRT